MAKQYFYGQDYYKSFEWATKAAGEGDKLDQFRLAHALDQGLGCERDWVKAFHWYSSQRGRAIIFS